MTSFPGAGGAGGTGAGFQLFVQSDNQSGIYTNAAARDAYFDANQSEVDRVAENEFLIIKLLDNGSAEIAYQQYLGDAGVPNDSGDWNDVTSLVQGETGAAGATGNSFFFKSIVDRDNFFSVSPNETLLKTDLPIMVNIGGQTTSNFIWAGVDAPVLYDPDDWRFGSLESGSGELILGDSGTQINTGNEVLGFITPDGDKHYIEGVGYDDTGSTNPMYWELAARISTPISDVFDTQLSDPQDLAIVIPADSMTLAISIRPATIGSLRLIAYRGLDNTGPVIVDADYNVGGGSIGNELLLTLPHDFFVETGDSVFVEFSGIDLFGGIQTSGPFIGQNVIFVTLDQQLGTAINIASEPFVDTKVIYTADGSINEDRTVTIEAASSLTFDSSLGDGVTVTGDLAVGNGDSQFDFDATSGDDTTDVVLNASSILMSQDSLTGQVRLDMNETDGILITDNAAGKGAEYDADYKANFTERSLVDKNYSDFESLLARNVQTTGLVEGGQPSPASPTTLNITSGTGYITDYTDPMDPIFTKVTWSAFIGYNPVNLATPGSWILSIDINGDIVESNAGSVNSLALQNQIFIGGYSTNGVQLVAFVDVPRNIGYNGQATFKSFIRDVIGPANVTGNVIDAGGTDLTLANSGGTIFIQGSNFRINKQIPDERLIATAPTMSFARTLRIAAGQDIKFDGTGLQTVINPAQWDDGTGVLATVPVNDFTVQVAHISPTGEYSISYGQEIFNTLALAETAVLNGTLEFEEAPTLLLVVRRTFIIVKNNATDLSNVTQAEFIQDGKFRGGGASVSGGIAGINTPGGADTNVQFNQMGAFGGESNFAWNYVDNALTVTGTINGANFELDTIADSIFITDINPVDFGSNSVVIGNGAAPSSASGSSGNTIVGKDAGLALTTSIDNVLIGMGSGESLSVVENAFSNVVIGNTSMQDATTAVFNTIVGRGSLQNAVTANEVVILGGNSCNDVTTGDNLVVVGTGCATTLTTGTDNILIGHDTQVPTPTTSEYLNIGNAIYADTTSSYFQIGGTNVKPVGPHLLEVSGSAVVLGNINGAIIEKDNGNVFLGAGNIPDPFGPSNTVIGDGAFSSATSSGTDENVIIGSNAAMSVTGTTTPSVVIGKNCALNATQLSQHVLIGSNTANNGITTGFGSTIVGHSAAQNIVGALTRNTFLGAATGNSMTDGSRVTLIGNSIDVPSASITNFLNITDTIFADVINQFVQIGGLNVKPSGPETLNVQGDLVVTGSITKGGTGINNVTIEGDLTDFNLYVGDGLPALIGIKNTVVGYNSGVTNNILANSNTVFGESVAPSLPGSSSRNVLLGKNIFSSLTISSSDNIVIGGELNLPNVANCSFNTIIGDSSLADVSTLTNNTIIGRQILQNVTNSERNVVIGNSAGTEITGALDDSILIGYDVTSPIATTNNYLNIGNLIQGDLGNGKISIGATAGNKPAGDQTLLVEGQTILNGTVNGVFIEGDATDDNVALGDLLPSGIDGNDNLFVGFTVAPNATTINNSTFIGDLVCSTGIVTGNQNTFVGASIAQDLTSGEQNAGFGYLTLSGLTLGDDNTCFGRGSGQGITEGSSNICIGHDTGTTALDSANILIGKSKNVFGTKIDNLLNIGDLLLGDISAGTLRIGNVGDGDLPNDIQLDLGASAKALRLNRVTTASEGTLNLANGMIWYNSTTNQFRGVKGGSIVSFLTA